MLDTSTSAAAALPQPAPRVRLDYLDGLRGLAALYVVFHHALMEIDFRYDGAGLPRPLVHATSWLIYGQLAVDVFIVLSGYCLMMPVARSENGVLRGGVRDFFLRRARRILPPYFAAMIACLLVIGLIPSVMHSASVRWPGVTNPFALSDLLSHVLLIHNLFRPWTWAIDYPMWSVASEWQIYFLFPLVLLPLWRRFGSIAPILVGFAFGLACYRWLPQIDQACPHFVGLFALGMGAAVVNFSSAAQPQRWRTQGHWGTLAIISALLAAVLCKVSFSWLHAQGLLTDALIGTATACFLVSATRHLTDPDRFAMPGGLRLCASRGAVLLGTFSYSLYLVHAPVLAIVHDLAARFTLTPAGMLLVLFAIGVPLAVAVAYLFYRLFERPFMPGHPRTEKQAAQSAVVSPAP